MSLTYNLADLWEEVLPHVADRVALVVDDRSSTYAELEERGNRLADHLASAGIGPGDHVGCYLYNCTEYLETMLAAYKLRAVPINVNYRYVEDELRYLFADADLKAVVHNTDFDDRVASVLGSVPAMRTVLSVGEGGTYEAALAAASPEQKAIERSGDDHYIVYTGGTTGMPKGVVWRQEDAFYSCFGGGDYSRANPIKGPSEITSRIMGEHQLVFFPIAPMMHGAAQWTTWSWFFAGGKNVLTSAWPRTDYAQVWKLVTEHKANVLTIIGDAVSRPLIDEYKANPGKYDASSVLSFGSGAVPLTASARAEIADTFPHCIINDGYGASETGAQAANTGDGTFRSYDGETLVLDPDTLEEIPPGSDREGRVARTGHIPLRYYNDPEKSAATFVEKDGRRWVLTGDVATVLDDGRIKLMGRGSQCINSGGEKIFPEEVEAALRAHPSVYDTLVVGIPDPRWGERVAAVVSVTPGAKVTDEELIEFCRTKLAGYKVPRLFSYVEEVRRSPAGKADYGWAKQTAIEAAGA